MVNIQILEKKRVIEILNKFHCLGHKFFPYQRRFYYACEGYLMK